MASKLFPKGASGWALAAAAACLVGPAIVRIHLRIQATLVGYEIGHLKSEEGRLLEQRSALKMELAKVTSKKHLMAASSDTGQLLVDAEPGSH